MLRAVVQPKQLRGRRRGPTWSAVCFRLGGTKVPEQQRKYVKAFDGTLSIWIGADGTPLASETHAVVKGRAFLVVGFEAVDDTSSTYGVVGDRLLTLRSEHRMASSGAGEHGEQRSIKTLQPQD
jgi:hypothetical protein